MTAEERAAFNAKQKEYQRKLRENLTDEQRAKRNAKQREYYRLRKQREQNK